MRLPLFIQRRPVAVKVLVAFALVAALWARVSASQRGSSATAPEPLPKDCVSRLVLVDEAITCLADNTGIGKLTPPTEIELMSYLVDPSLLKCPEGGKYVFGTSTEATSCNLHGHASFSEPVPPPLPLMERLRRSLPWIQYRGPCGGGKSSCIANLKQMDGAKQQWAVEARKQDTETPKPSEIFGKDLYIRSFPTCLAGGK